jgi:hypothetical protein
MAAPLLPPKNVGPITYVYNGRTATVSWPYFTYDSNGRNALQKQAMPGGNLDLNAVVVAQAIQNSLDKAATATVQKEAADRKAANDAAYAAAAARTYAEMNASTLPTTVITLGSTTPQPIKPFTTNKPILATKVVVITAKPNSRKVIKTTPKKPNTTQQSSPGKGTPNKNPPIPPPPPPPPDIRVSLCLPGTYLDIKTGKCVPCPTGKGQYIRGSGCQPCPPGSTGESIHTGCTRVGPDGNSYTMIA